jgi:hypothetical protein
MTRDMIRIAAEGGNLWPAGNNLKEEWSRQQAVN